MNSVMSKYMCMLMLVHSSAAYVVVGVPRARGSLRMSIQCQQRKRTSRIPKPRPTKDQQTCHEADGLILERELDEARARTTCRNSGGRAAGALDLDVRRKATSHNKPGREPVLQALQTAANTYLRTAR
ncbi:hypothetical protein CMUS01_00210 [Colletotrichum musicola]|uniref:Secreted protein n=1 Tax=Colletotrichum musicola TaxID=2175873 RepID=A0A8H6UA81_9PEZI|nr:hypothetical protein CMUS01_00210 [Colletotrichum musicola]